MGDSWYVAPTGESYWELPQYNDEALAQADAREAIQNVNDLVNVVVKPPTEGQVPIEEQVQELIKQYEPNGGNKQYGGLNMSLNELLKKLDDRYNKLYNKYTKIYNKIKSLGLKTVINPNDINNLNSDISELKILESKRDEIIKDINKKLNDDERIKFNTIKSRNQQINTIVTDLNKLAQKNYIELESPEIYFIYITLIRLKYVINFCTKILEEISKPDKKEDNIILTKIIDELDKSNEFASIFSTDSIINSVNLLQKIITTQIEFYNKTKESLRKEQELLSKKKTFFINLKNFEKKINPTDLRTELLKNIRTETESETKEINYDLKNIKSINDEIERIKETKDTNIKDTTAKLTIPPISGGALSMENIHFYIYKNSGIYMQNALDCKTLFIEQINKIIGLRLAAEKNINIMTMVKCNKLLTEILNSFNFSKNNVSKTINGYVIDIIHDNNNTKLRIKTETGEIVQNLEYCNPFIINNSSTTISPASLIEVNNDGFTIGSPVMCKQKLSPDKIWNNKSNEITQGIITDIIEENTNSEYDSSKISFILKDIKTLKGKSLDSDIHNTKFKKDECKLSYKLAIEKLDEKKNQAYIIKQTQKLKDVAQKIDNLDIKSKDYDYKLNILNKLYDRIKRDIENKLHHKELTKEELEEDEKEKNKLIKQIQESKLNNEISELNQEKIRLQKLLKEEVNKEQGHIGGLDRIQRAGFIPTNYLDLKENINKVNLDSILLESKSLLRKLI